MTTTRTDLRNADVRVVDGFGDEWSRFDQVPMSDQERARIAGEYFALFPWERLPGHAVGADFGCGSGRWAAVVAPRVGHLYCVDASEAALQVARRNLGGQGNCTFLAQSIDSAPIPDGALDFAYCLGVLHHVPDTESALRSCVRKLKRGAPLLVYLYYNFDNRPAWFRALWRCSELLRALISRLPHWLRYATTQAVAAVIYWPLARVARLSQKIGIVSAAFPLAYYADKSFYVMRTDALDRFGTRLEKRFSRAEIAAMMTRAGLTRIVFNTHAPFWCAVGYRE